MEGYIKLYRQLLQSDIQHTSPCQRELWQFFLLSAQHSDFKDLKRGQFYFRHKDFQDAYSWYIGYRKMTYKKWEITKSMRSFCERNMIATMKATHGTLVTILNYDKYNASEDSEGNNEVSMKATRKQLGTTNINKNDKNEKNIFISFSENYRKFINAFNEKTKRNFKGDSKSQRQFNTRLKEGYTAEQMLQALENARQEKNHIESNFRYLTPEFITRGDKLEKFLNTKSLEKRPEITNDSNELFIAGSGYMKKY